MPSTLIWINQRQPQTLVTATMFLYIRAAFGVLFGYFINPIGVLILAGLIGGGLGIANERKIGYYVAVAMAFLPLVLYFGVARYSLGEYGLISLIFDIALIAVLLHQQSRGYVRLWFK